MKKISFEVEESGFYGAYWENKNKSNSALIAMLGDDPSDYLAKTCVKWLHKNGVNVMTMSPAKKGLRTSQLPSGAHRKGY